MSETPNDNCLCGMQCPACGSYGPYRIACITTVEMFDEGSEDVEDLVHEDYHGCECKECGHEATVAEFRGETPSQAPPFTLHSELHVDDARGALYLVSGRFSFDDDDLCFLIQAAEGDRAGEVFKQILREIDPDNPNDIVVVNCMQVGKPFAFSV